MFFQHLTKVFIKTSQRGIVPLPVTINNTVLRFIRTTESLSVSPDKKRTRDSSTSDSNDDKKKKNCKL